MRHVPSLLLAALVAACSGSSTSTSSCGGVECVGGELCAEGSCRKLCNTTADCASSTLFCDSGLCMPTSGTNTAEPPSITSVDGTGSVDGKAGHTSRHLQDRLVISGQHLMGATVSLAGADATYPLSPCEAGSSTRMVVGLPAELEAGAYTLTVTNQAGSCSANLSLLQGEPGSLEASGAQLITSINQASDADPAARVRGALHGQASSIMAMASQSLSSARSIVINGVQQVDSSAPGLFIAVFDLATHTVRDETLGTYMETKMAVSTTDPLQRQGLHDLLGALDPDDVLVLVSTGDVSAVSADASLVARLKDYGASPNITSLTSADGYVLIGMKGLGEGNGLEQVGGAGRNGLASLATVALDQGLVGLRQQPNLDARYLNASGDTVSGALTFAQNPVFNDNAIPASAVGFNYAASSSKGGAASDVACTTCISSGELADDAVTAAKVGFNYAASSSEGGAASDVACTTCISNGEIADGAVTTAKVASGSKKAMYQGPVACGSIITSSSTCSTISCGKDSYGTVYYYDCSANCYTWRTSPVTNCSTTLFGYVLQ